MNILKAMEDTLEAIIHTTSDVKRLAVAEQLKAAIEEVKKAAPVASRKLIEDEAGDSWWKYMSVFEGKSILAKPCELLYTHPPIKTEGEK